jgi:hypothetical protein
MEKKTNYELDLEKEFASVELEVAAIALGFGSDIQFIIPKL